MHVAVDALVQSWQLEAPAAERLLEKTAARLQYLQQRNARARACHTRTTVRRLHRLGIKLTHLPRCDIDTS